MRREGALKGKLSVGRSSRGSLLLWRSSCSGTGSLTNVGFVSLLEDHTEKEGVKSHFSVFCQTLPLHTQKLVPSLPTVSDFTVVETFIC